MDLLVPVRRCTPLVRGYSGRVHAYTYVAVGMPPHQKQNDTSLAASFRSTCHALPTLRSTQTTLTFVPISSTVRLRLLHCLIIGMTRERVRAAVKNKKKILGVGPRLFDRVPIQKFRLFVLSKRKAPFFAPRPHSRNNLSQARIEGERTREKERERHKKEPR